MVQEAAEMILSSADRVFSLTEKTMVLQIVACRSRDNYLLSACVDVSLGLVLGAVETCALENNVNADLAPRKILSVLLSVDGQGLAVNSDSTASHHQR